MSSFYFLLVFLQSVSGTNVVGILKSENFNTATDEFVILGAHLDTMGLQNIGVNKDGSGLTALITLAEDLSGELYHENVN